VAIELRLRTGDREYFPYSHLLARDTHEEFG